MADRWFPSSKTCSGCGAVKTRLALPERTYTCTVCGLVLTGMRTPHATWPHSRSTSPRVAGRRKTPPGRPGGTASAVPVEPM
ncbi:zinc ribbon domain-containing protein [Actinoallomurus iriomotensis]|uniref:zinc ribbon domain-containing protein n=1 Tax=Actinoallomurus iriomotensis TaxID=478107 RepID=UPI003D7F29E8